MTDFRIWRREPLAVEEGFLDSVRGVLGDARSQAVLSRHGFKGLRLRNRCRRVGDVAVNTILGNCELAGIRLARSCPRRRTGEALYGLQSRVHLVLFRRA